MSINKNNQTYKKTSFLTGVNSDYIQEYYALYLQNPNLLTRDWIEFFDGLQDDSKNILQNIKGPSWNPKKVKQIENIKNYKTKTDEEVTEFNSVKQASTDSVRATPLDSWHIFEQSGKLFVPNVLPSNCQRKAASLLVRPEV